MGQVNTEQAVAIIEAVTTAVDAATPDEVVNVVQPAVAEPNYWWSLALLLVPIWFAWWLKRKKK
ncbi:MAG: hypothetical protein ACW987_08990 [Candidatus Thorarchaeota archaeon]|jgi:hypothetical protein